MVEKADRKQPEIRFTGFDGEWNATTLGELGKVATNKRIFMHDTASTGDVPFYKIGSFGREPKLFISQSLFDEYKERFPFPETGDLLFSVIGSIGRVVEYEGRDEYFQDSNIVWLQHNGAVDNTFLKQFYAIVEWSGLEGSTIKHLYNRNILATKISLPCREEQTKIGAYFKTLDRMIVLHQRKHDKLVTLKQAMLQKMFPQDGATTSEIRFKGFEGDWVEEALDKLTVEIGTGKSTFVVSPLKSRSNPYPVLGSRSVIGYEKNYDYSGDFILTARVGENAGKLYRYAGKAKITDNTVYIACENSTFLFYHLTASDLTKLSFGTGQPLIKSSELKGLSVRLPESQDEQEKIGMYFRKLDDLISKHANQLEKLKNIKSACLEKMFV